MAILYLTVCDVIIQNNREIIDTEISFEAFYKYNNFSLTATLLYRIEVLFFNCIHLYGHKLFTTLLVNIIQSIYSETGTHNQCVSLIYEEGLHSCLL